MVLGRNHYYCYYLRSFSGLCVVCRSVEYKWRRRRHTYAHTPTPTHVHNSHKEAFSFHLHYWSKRATSNKNNNKSNNDSNQNTPLTPLASMDTNELLVCLLSFVKTNRCQMTATMTSAHLCSNAAVVSTGSNAIFVYIVAIASIGFGGDLVLV